MNIFPYSNFHDLNLDWLLQMVKQLRTDVDGLIGSATPSNDPPEMDGVAAPGSSVNYSRGDHVHPTDTSRASATALADEITARTNKDLSLDGDIAAVDAKIHFSASNPLMDGSATAGFSTDQARADHIHPTDTSRAAAADLTQEINDRANADTTLQNNINAVDAKIVLATGAPLMDSSSATPGSSTSMARADHVHPTDTSRASATDLATLTARVDSFTGSAIASDATPQMDGVGSAGTGGNYSRGDHVHPSDTSKVDKAGDTMTGPLKVQSSFNCTNQEVFFHSNSIGWVRVIDAPEVLGNTAVIAISKKGAITPSEFHVITLSFLDSGAAFQNEYSKGDGHIITKVRYSDAGKVDIYIDQNYDSDIGIKIYNLGATEAETNLIKTVTPSAVLANPPGETILETHNMAKNSEIQSAVTGGTYAATVLNSILYRQNHIMTGFFKVNVTTEVTANGWRIIANIPDGFRPAAQQDGLLLNTTTDDIIHARIETTGAVEVWTPTAIPTGNSLYMNLSYYTA